MSLALIFPGQGAQTPGMGAGVLDAGSPGNAMAREASELVGLDLVRLACEGGVDEIRPTEVAQPLLLLLSAALLEALPSQTRTQVTGVAGHSLGEYTALIAAGSLDLRGEHPPGKTSATAGDGAAPGTSDARVAPARDSQGAAAGARPQN